MGSHARSHVKILVRFEKSSKGASRLFSRFVENQAWCSQHGFGQYAIKRARPSSHITPDLHTGVVLICEALCTRAQLHALAHDSTRSRCASSTLLH